MPVPRREVAVVPRPAQPRAFPLLRLRRGRRRLRVRPEDRARQLRRGRRAARRPGRLHRHLHGCVGDERAARPRQPQPAARPPTRRPRSSTPRPCSPRRPRPRGSICSTATSTPQAAAHFGCGFAPSGWDSLTKHLLRKGFEFKELEAAGLSREGRRGPMDRFHRRLLWPIRASGGDVIGFGARRIFDDDRDGGEVRQHPRDRALQEVAGAVRPRPGQARHRQGASGGRGRGLHRRDGHAPGRRDHRRRLLRHRVRRRAPVDAAATHDGRQLLSRRADLRVRRRRRGPGGGGQGVRGGTEPCRTVVRRGGRRRDGPVRSAAEVW